MAKDPFGIWDAAYSDPNQQNRDAPSNNFEETSQEPGTQRQQQPESYSQRPETNPWDQEENKARSHQDYHDGGYADKTDETGGGGYTEPQQNYNWGAQPDYQPNQPSHYEENQNYTQPQTGQADAKTPFDMEYEDSKDKPQSSGAVIEDETPNIGTQNYTQQEPQTTTGYGWQNPSYSNEYNQPRSDYDTGYQDTNQHRDTTTENNDYTRKNETYDDHTTSQNQYGQPQHYSSQYEDNTWKQPSYNYGNPDYNTTQHNDYTTSEPPKKSYLDLFDDWKKEEQQREDNQEKDKQMSKDFTHETTTNVDDNKNIYSSEVAAQKDDTYNKPYEDTQARDHQYTSSYNYGYNYNAEPTSQYETHTQEEPKKEATYNYDFNSYAEEPKKETSYNYDYNYGAERTSQYDTHNQEEPKRETSNNYTGGYNYNYEPSSQFDTHNQANIQEPKKEDRLDAFWNETANTNNPSTNYYGSTSKEPEYQIGAQIAEKTDFTQTSTKYEPTFNKDFNAFDQIRNDSKVGVYSTPERIGEDRSTFDRKYLDERPLPQKVIKTDAKTQTSPKASRSPLAKVFESPVGTVAQEVSAQQLDRDEIYEKVCALLECKRSNKNFVRPLAKYIVELANIYAGQDVRQVPQKYSQVIQNSDESVRTFSNQLERDINNINNVIQDLENSLRSQIQTLKDNVINIAREKHAQFQKNHEFFKDTISRYYPNENPKMPPIESVIEDLGYINEEKDIKAYLADLLPKEEVESAETQNYLSFLTQKLSSQEQCEFKKNRNPLEEASVQQIKEALSSQITLFSNLVLDHVDYLYNFEDLSQYKASKIKIWMDRAAMSKPTVFSGNPDEAKYYYSLSKTVKTEQKEGINCISVIDNKLLAVGSNDQTIKLYRLSDLSLIDTLRGHKDAICALTTFSASRVDLQAKAPRANSIDESKVILLASGSGSGEGKIGFWDISWALESSESHKDGESKSNVEDQVKSRLVRRVEGHQHGVSAIMELGDGLSVFSGSAGGQICVWNVLRNKQLGQLGFHKAMVTSIKLLACKHRIASASWDRKIAIWRVNYQKVVNSKSAHPDREVLDKCELEKVIDPGFPIMALNAFLKKANWIVFAGGINRIIIWDVDIGRLVREYECEKTNITELVLLEDESMQQFFLTGICCNDDTLRVWSGNYKEQIGVENEIYNFKDQERIFAGSSGVFPKLQFLIESGEPTLAVVNNVERRASVSFLKLNV